MFACTWSGQGRWGHGTSVKTKLQHKRHKRLPQQQCGQTLKALWVCKHSGEKSGKTLWQQGGSSVPLHKERKRCCHEVRIWHSCRVPKTPECCRQASIKSPKRVSKGWESHPPAPWTGLRAQTHTHTRAGCRRESPTGIRNMASPTNVGSNGIS